MSFVQTAEGALNEVHSILQRMRELAVDAANTATTDGVAQQAEVTQLLAEITAIGTNSTFAGKTVFPGLFDHQPDVPCWLRCQPDPGDQCEPEIYHGYRR